MFDAIREASEAAGKQAKARGIAVHTGRKSYRKKKPNI